MTMPLSVARALVFGLLLSLPVAARADDETGALLTTVRFERSLHFQTPAGDAIVVPSGTYAVTEEGQQGLRRKVRGKVPG